MGKNRFSAYELIKEENLSDIHSKGSLLKHKKTGARVLIIENDDENKVFNIAFRTPPADSTGVAHILEHCVLCGSKNFPLKDPFVELVKGSLNTFLNAMTYPDKTCYPVASCNDQDFQNLMHVYLDAVFYPNIYDKEEIFRQEGWSYQLENLEGPLKYNGVVYNEMKGAFSSPDEVLEREIMNSLFPDTSYGYESGGNPENIPELTYQQFLDFHKTYYHPSNSYIYLYGNMDMDEKLDFIDANYLSKYEYLKVDSELKIQEGFDKCKEIEMYYPVSEAEGTKDNTYLSYNMSAGSASDSTLCMAFEVLDYALLSAPGAPLKQALLDAKIGKDVYGSFDDGILQPYFTIIAKGSEKSKKDEFVSIIRNTLTEIVENGINKKAIEAGINYFEFRYREADFSSYPKGLMYGLDIMGNWLYDDENPFSSVKLLEVFDSLKNMLHEGYFEKLIQRYLLDNTYGSVLVLEPEPGLVAKKEKELETALESHLNSLSEEEKLSLIEKTKHLEEYQEAEEDLEALKCIPMLKRNDIKKEAEKFYNEAIDVQGSLFLYHEVCTNGIGYADILFDINNFGIEQVHYLGLLKSVLGYVDTLNYTYGELFNEINSNTGGINCGVELFQSIDQEEMSVKFGIRGKALYPKYEFLFHMISEIINTSKISDTKRLYEIIAQIKSRAQASLVSGGHSTAVLRSTSYGSSSAAFQDEMSGIGYYHFIEQLEKDFENKKEEIVHKLSSLLREIFCKDNISISYTGERDSLEKVKELFGKLKEQLPVKEDIEKRQPILNEKKNEGFKTASQVQYVAQTGNFRKAGYEYTGALQILKVALSYDYLWINLRVKGGAYGCMSGFKRNGEGYFVSYRDPHIENTLKVYQGIPEYIREFQADEREMTKYIIGTISGKDVPKTPQQKGAVSKIAYFCHISEELVQKERDQILNATVEDIHSLAPIVEAILDAKQICVVGSENAIEKSKKVFTEVKTLINC